MQGGGPELINSKNALVVTPTWHQWQGCETHHSRSVLAPRV